MSQPRALSSGREAGAHGGRWRSGKGGRSGEHVHAERWSATRPRLVIDPPASRWGGDPVRPALKKHGPSALAVHPTGPLPRRERRDDAAERRWSPSGRPALRLGPWSEQAPRAEYWPRDAEHAPRQIGAETGDQAAQRVLAGYGAHLSNRCSRSSSTRRSMSSECPVTWKM